MFLHSSIPYTRLDLNTNIQAVAVRAQIGSLITICNVYSSRSHDISTNILNDLLHQLPSPAIIVGDFTPGEVLVLILEEE